MTAYSPSLRALARAASGGVWGTYVNDGKGVVYTMRSVVRRGGLVQGVITGPLTLAVAARPADAAFMAAASPAAVLELIDRAEYRSTLHGFYRNPCIHESGAELVSLHATKAGAWRAMRAAKFAAAMAERDMALLLGRRGGFWFNVPLEDQVFLIQPVTVLP